MRKAVKRLLITGAGGFLGQHCLEPATLAGFKVHAADLRPLRDRPSAVTFHELDLLDAAATERLVEETRPTHLLHLAWVTTHGQYWTSPLNEVWVEASKHLLASFQRQGGERAVMVGTCAEYDWSEGLCDEISTPIRPMTPYGQAKAQLHQALAELAGRHSLSYAWARLFFLYGPGESPARFVPSVVRALLAGEPAACSEGSHQRDYIYVGDAAEALVKLTASEVTGPVNVGSGRAIAIRDLALTIGRLLGAQELVRIGSTPRRDEEAPLVVARSERLSREVKYEPRHDLEGGLRETISWWSTPQGESGNG
jgi:nucleoside-diphosphate-sugar epimerase